MKCNKCGKADCNSLRDDRGYYPCNKKTKMVPNSGGGWDRVEVGE